jgi:hypothetical protein
MLRYKYKGSTDTKTFKTTELSPNKFRVSNSQLFVSYRHQNDNNKILARPPCCYFTLYNEH